MVERQRAPRVPLASAGGSLTLDRQPPWNATPKLPPNPGKNGCTSTPLPHVLIPSASLCEHEAHSGDDSSDAVATYMRQMGRASLLTRQHELRLAKAIRDARHSFCKNMLRIDFVLQAVVADLEQVAEGHAAGRSRA